MLAQLVAEKGNIASHLYRLRSIVLILLFLFFSLFFSYLSYKNVSGTLLMYQNRQIADLLDQRFQTLSAMGLHYVDTGKLADQLSYHDVMTQDNQSDASGSLALYWHILMPENSPVFIANENKHTVPALLRDLQLPENENSLLMVARDAGNRLSKVMFQAFSVMQNSALENREYAQSNAREEALSLLSSHDYLNAQDEFQQAMQALYALQTQRIVKQLIAQQAQRQVYGSLALLCYLCLILAGAYHLYLHPFTRPNRDSSLSPLGATKRGKQLQHALEESAYLKKQLLECQEMAALGRLVNDVVHEVNTPLGNASTLATDLQDETQLLLKKIDKETLKRSDLEQYGDDTVQKCNLLQSNLKKTAHLIGSFKQVSVDRSDDQPRTFQLSEYIDEVMLSLSPMIKKTAIIVDIKGPDNEPLVTTYPGAIAQIVTNLVSNALMHGFDAEKRTGKITIEVIPKVHQMRLIIQDNGKGMAPEVADKIFEPFFTTQRAKGGSGLGMHLVHKLVKQRLTGTLKCQSTLGKGTAFNICFPMQIEQ